MQLVAHNSLNNCVHELRIKESKMQYKPRTYQKGSQIMTDRQMYNPKLYMIFFKDGGLFSTKLDTEAGMLALLAHQKNGGFDEDLFAVCHYDYSAEEFFNEDIVLTYDDEIAVMGRAKETLIKTGGNYDNL